jgi:chromosome partitioning protein
MVISRNQYLRGSASLRVVKCKPPRSIVVANSKGGCGKTTLASNLAAWCANQGKATALVDHDPQASSSYWLKQRPSDAAPIVGIAAYAQPGAQETRSFQHRLPRDIQRVVLDTPAALSGTMLYRVLSGADLIVVPIVPSPIDIHAAEGFLHEIHISGLLREHSRRILVVANRVRKNTLMFKHLNSYLQSLDLPRVTYIRDSQLYTQAAEVGLGISDLRGSRSALERNHWMRIGSWIENRFALQEFAQENELADSADTFAGL